jgi:hypothetical protein
MAVVADPVGQQEEDVRVLQRQPLGGGPILQQDSSAPIGAEVPREPWVSPLVRLSISLRRPTIPVSGPMAGSTGGALA